MFKIKRMELYNWSYFPPYTTVELNPSLNLLLGENGSGKTSLINAIRVCLGGNTYSTGSNRERQSFKNYMLFGEKAFLKLLITNYTINRECIFGKIRPKHWTETEYISLICVLHKYNPREHYVGLGDIKLKEFKDNSKTLRKEKLLSEKFGVEFFRDEILGKVGMTRSFIDTISQEQGRVPDFVHLNDEELYSSIFKIIDISDIADRYEIERKRYLEVKAEEDKIVQLISKRELERDRLNERVENFRRYVSYKEKYELNHDYYYPLVTVKKQNERINDLLSKVEELKSENRNLINHLEKLKRNIEVQDRAIKNGLSHSQELHHKIEKLKEDLLESKYLKEAYEKENQQYEKKLSEISNIKINEKGSLELTDVEIDNLLSRFKAEHEDRYLEFLSLKKEWSDLHTKLRKLSSENIDANNYPHYVRDKLNDIKREFSLNDIDHQVVCDAVEILDNDWQTAIEGVLGNRRFDIIVKESDIVKAKVIANKIGFRNRIMIGKEYTKTKNPDTLFDKINVSNDKLNITGRIAFLNNYYCVNSIEEGDTLSQKGKRSITIDAYEQDEERSGISRKLDSKNLCCGSKSREYLQQIKKDEISSLEKEIAIVENQYSFTEKKYRDTDSKIALLNKIKDVKSNETLIEENKYKIIELNTSIDKSNQELQEAEKEHQKLFIAMENDKNEYEKSQNEQSNVEQTIQQNKSEIDYLSKEISDLKEEYDELVENVKEFDPGKQYDIEEQLDKVMNSPEHYKKEYEKYAELIANYEDMHERYKADDNRYPIERKVVLHFRHKIEEIEEYKKLFEKTKELKEKRIFAYETAKEIYEQYINSVLQAINRKLQTYSELLDIECSLAMTESESGKPGINYKIRFAEKPITTWKNRKLSGGEATVSNILLFISVTNYDNDCKPNFIILDEHTSNLDNRNMLVIEDFFLSTDMQCLFSTPKVSEARLFENIKQYIFLTPKRSSTYWPYPAFLTKESFNEQVEILKSDKTIK